MPSGHTGVPSHRPKNVHQEHTHSVKWLSRLCRGATPIRLGHSARPRCPAARNRVAGAPLSQCQVRPVPHFATLLQPSSPGWAIRTSHGHLWRCDTARRQPAKSAVQAFCMPYSSLGAPVPTCDLQLALHAFWHASHTASGHEQRERSHGTHDECTDEYSKNARRPKPGTGSLSLTTNVPSLLHPDHLTVLVRILTSLALYAVLRPSQLATPDPRPMTLCSHMACHPFTLSSSAPPPPPHAVPPSTTYRSPAPPATSCSPPPPSSPSPTPALEGGRQGAALGPHVQVQHLPRAATNSQALQAHGQGGSEGAVVRVLCAAAGGR